MTKISINSPGGGGSTSPAGTNGEVQFNDSGSFGADSNFNWDNTNKRLGLGIAAPVGILHLKTTAQTTRLVIDGDAAQNRLISLRTAGLQRWGLYCNNVAESGSNAGSNFLIRRYNDAGTFVDAPFSIDRSNGRVSIIERLLLEADSTATTQSTAVIQNPTINSGIAIVPNGTGAITAAIPNGTSTGGNARGTNAVDFQTSRAANSNVASGANSTISGGDSNTASSNFSTVNGGQSNTASTNNHATVLGGQNNVSSGNRSISGGFFSNATGSNSIALGSSSSSGTYSVSIGLNNVISDYASALGGEFNRSYNKYSVVLGGTKSNAYLYNSLVTNSNSASEWGDNQLSQLSAFRYATLSSTATTVLSLDGTGVTNLIIPNLSVSNLSWNVNINWLAVVTSITGTATGVKVGDTIAQCLVLGFKKVANVSSIVGSPGSLFTNADTSMLTALLTPTAGGSQQLALTFTAPSFSGGGSISCKIVAKIELVEISW
jgi:hypothetical protein